MVGVLYKHESCQAKEFITDLPLSWEVPPTASKCERFKKNIKSIFLASPRSIETAHYIRSEPALHEEWRKQAESKHSFLIHPFSDFLIAWRLYVAVIFSVSLLIDPMIVYVTKRKFLFRSLIFYTFYLTSITDIIIKFFTAYNNPKTKETIFDIKAAAVNYLKKDFIIDIIGAIPMQVILTHIKKSGIRDAMMFFQITRCYTLFQYIKLCCNQFEIQISTRFRFELFLKIAIFIQTTTSLYYQMERLVFVSRYGRRGIASDSKLQVWYLEEKLNRDSTSLMERYISTLFFVSGLLFTAGRSYFNTDLIQELYICTAIMLLGHIFFCYIIILICCDGALLYWGEITFNIILNGAMNFCTKKSLPSAMCEKIMILVNYKWRGKMFNEESIMNSVSTQLQLELKLDDCERLLYGVPFLNDLPNQMIIQIVDALKFNIHLPGEVLVEPGMISDKLIMIKFGSVSIRDQNNDDKFQLKDSDYLGESSLLKDFFVHNIYAVTVELTETYTLDLNDWNTIVWKFPSVGRKFERMRNNVLRYDDEKRRHRRSIHEIHESELL